MLCKNLMKHRLYTGHMTKLITVLIVISRQGALLVQVSHSNRAWIFRFMEDCKPPKLLEATKRQVALRNQSQSAFTCAKLTIETLEKGVKYVQS